MTTLARVVVPWTGSGVVGGGVSTFYTLGTGPDLQADLTVFFNAIKGGFTPAVSWAMPTSGEEIDDNDGSIVGAWAGGTGGTITGTNAGNYAAGVGARIVWDTAGITGGRRVKGSTYLVPIVSSQYAVDGTIENGILSTFETAANALVTNQAGALVIVSRKTSAHSGSSNAVTSARVPDKVSWLRSRRT